MNIVDCSLAGYPPSVYNLMQEVQMRGRSAYKSIYIESKNYLKRAIAQAKADLEQHQINDINKAKSSGEMWQQVTSFLATTIAIVKAIVDGS